MTLFLCFAVPLGLCETKNKAGFFKEKLNGPASQRAPIIASLLYRCGHSSPPGGGVFHRQAPLELPPPLLEASG
jgi:hypothetical protein